MKFISKIAFVFLLASSGYSFAQQIDYKDFVRVDSNIINRNTVFNWYWSSVLNKQLKVRHVKEYRVTCKGGVADTQKINTLAFDQNGRLKRWNSVAFRYAFQGIYLGYVDTLTNMAVLPLTMNMNAFTDYQYYSEKRDTLNNFLFSSEIIEKPKSDLLKIEYSYHPDMYIKGREIEYNGNLFLTPDGPKCYLNAIKIYQNSSLIYERFLVYELYEN
jgi:hypothetical protein